MNARSLLLPLLCAALSVQAADFALQSPDLVEGGKLSLRQVYDASGCHGGNRSPALAWHGAPAATRSFAVTVYDPDAPTGRGWWHWTVFDLPPSTHGLPAGAGNPGGELPTGARQGRSDFGSSGYGGACPPAGDKPHRYQFTVWALDVPSLGLGAASGGAMVGYALRTHVLGQARITVTYGR
jgi:hypothetical protein